MTDDLVARVRSPFALTEQDAQEIADALEARGKRIDELESRLVDKEVRIAELEAALRPFAFREEIELTLENGAYPVKAIVVFKDEREAALKLLKGTKE